jgi:phosphatidylethanolamine/phosphatidyl-N-methylethanolamine N-methyltransferase
LEKSDFSKEYSEWTSKQAVYIHYYSFHWRVSQNFQVLLHPMNNSDLITFARSWLQAPKTIGAAVPSGRGLAKLMASQVDPHGDGLVVELGAGTGVITRALMARGVDPARLLVVEHDPTLAALVSRKLPQVQVICANARTLRSMLATAAPQRSVSTIISSLPLLAMLRSERWRIAMECHRALNGRGNLIQFTYSPFSPLPDRLLRSLGWQAKRAGVVLGNLPPAVVWHYGHALEHKHESD